MENNKTNVESYYLVLIAAYNTQFLNSRLGEYCGRKCGKMVRAREKSEQLGQSVYN